MTFCTNCGKNLRAGATQCDACGSALAAVSPSLSDAPISSNLDAEKTQVANQTDINTSTGGRSTLPISAAIGAQSGRLLGGRYKLEQCIGSGGMGAIYPAPPTHIGATLAGKGAAAARGAEEKTRPRFFPRGAPAAAAPPPP